MGKPSKTRLSKKQSRSSVKSTMSKEKMLAKVKKRDVLRKHQRTQQSINKLFHKNRSSRQNSRQSSSMTSTSIIDLEDSNTIMPAIKNEVSIIIPDDKEACPTRKFGHHTSTPKRSSFVDDVVFTGSSNNSRNRMHMKSFHTIDLTDYNTSSRNSSRNDPTVIEIEDTTDEVTAVLASNASSMSGDSDVTVLNSPVNRKLKKFKTGLKNLNRNQKERLLEVIAQTLFNECAVPNNPEPIFSNLQQALPREPESEYDTYIKNVILGGNTSLSSIGSNIYHPSRQRNLTGNRMIVIDGSNVAMTHGRGNIFSVWGLQICITYFLKKKHVVKAFVPQFRCKFGASSDPRLLRYLERQGLVIYTPSRQVQGKSVTPYDDRYIIQCAAEFEGVVVSCDNYRDLQEENPRWREVIEKRLLPFTWVDNMIMFPKDPLGRDGPTLEQFLRHEE